MTLTPAQLRVEVEQDANNIQLTELLDNLKQAHSVQKKKVNHFLPENSEILQKNNDKRPLSLLSNLFKYDETAINYKKAS